MALNTIAFYSASPPDVDLVDGLPAVIFFMIVNVKIEDLIKLDTLEYYVHELFKDYKFDFKEIIKLFDSDSGKHIISKTHIITKNKKFLIITKND